MAHSEIQHSSESALVTGLKRLGQFALLVGVLTMFGSPAFVAAGMANPAYYGLGILVFGLLSYGVGSLLARSSASDDLDAPPMSDEQVE